MAINWKNLPQPQEHYKLGELPPGTLFIFGIKGAPKSSKTAVHMKLGAGGPLPVGCNYTRLGSRPPGDTNQVQLGAVLAGDYNEFVTLLDWDLTVSVSPTQKPVSQTAVGPLNTQKAG